MVYSLAKYLFICWTFFITSDKKYQLTRVKDTYKILNQHILEALKLMSRAKMTYKNKQKKKKARWYVYWCGRDSTILDSIVANWIGYCLLVFSMACSPAKVCLIVNMMLTIFSITSDKTHQLYILWFPFKKAGIIQHIMNTFYFGLNRGSCLILLLFYFITKREDVKLPERLTVWVKTNPTGIARSS